MKRSDLTTQDVLEAVRDHFPSAYAHLTERFPKKVVIAAFERETRKGLLDFGTTIARPFLTAEGRRALERGTDGAPGGLTIIRADQTSLACPSQWDAWTPDDTRLYLRYRFGHGTVHRDGPSGQLLAEFEHGSELAGSMNLAEFCNHAGLTLNLGGAT